MRSYRVPSPAGGGLEMVVQMDDETAERVGAVLAEPVQLTAAELAELAELDAIKTASRVPANKARPAATIPNKSAG